MDVGRHLKLLDTNMEFCICFFTDYLLLFAESLCMQMRVIKQCLDEFARILGQKINLQKRNFFLLT